MRIVIQRVAKASVSLENPAEIKPGDLLPGDNAQPHSIGRGFLLLVGVADSDGTAEIQWAARKIANMRLFSDAEGKMNLALHDVAGEVLSISQFTLFGDIHKGNRPSFIAAGKPDHAKRIWQQFNAELRDTHHLTVRTGWFGTDMAVSLVNDGPVTILLDTDRDMPRK